MLLGWVKRASGFVLRFLLRFFGSLNRAMGCFFACFRIKDHHHRRTHLVSNSSRSTDVLISRNHLQTLFQSQEEDSANNRHVGVGSQGDDELGLKDQAKFLKACGTLPRTPSEIRNASEKLKVSPSTSDNDSEPMFHSWLPNTSFEKLQLDVQPFDLPTPLKLCQELGDSPDSIEQTPSSCLSNAQDDQHEFLDYMEGNRMKSLHTADRDEINAESVSSWPLTDTVKKNKSVRFQCDTDISSCGSSSDDWDMKKSRTPNNHSSNKSSPYPTPLKLFDDMQTPGTFCPATIEELPNGKTRVRSQFVYPIHKQGEKFLQCKILQEKDFNHEQESSCETSESVEQAPNSTPAPKKASNEVSINIESKEVSLSSWLKTAPIDQEERNKRVETAHSQTPHFGRTPGDRPIIGAAAAHFADENSQIRPPKWWDGNGIPNSTTKYKEDQKVYWHATPFEERLEKALSEESFPQRKLVQGKPIPFDDIEENDTALSQLQSPSTISSPSMVSF